MNTKYCLALLVVWVVFVSVGVQAVVSFQTNMVPKSFANVFVLESFNGDDANVNGGGGDPVPGPGIPL